MGVEAIFEGLRPITTAEFIGYSMALLVLIVAGVALTVFYSSRSKTTNENMLQMAVIESQKLFANSVTEATKAYSSQNAGLNDRVHQIQADLITQQQQASDQRLKDEQEKHELKLALQQLKSMQEAKIREIVDQEIKEMTQQLADKALEIERLRQENETLKRENEELRRVKEELEQKLSQLNHVNNEESEQ